MRQVIQNYRSGLLEVSDVPAPTGRSGGLIVANVCSLISAGTEKSTVSIAKKSLAGKAMDRPDMVRKVLDKARKDGIVDTLKMVFSRLDTPAALGYSSAGIVVEVGNQVTNFSVGDRVACAGQNYASHAEVVYVPKNLCSKLPDEVSFDEAAYVTLGAIALQGVRQADPRLGEIVAVVGLGLLGQLTVQLLKANGCRVVAADPAQEKRDMAVRFGADVAVAPGDLEDAGAAISQSQGVDAVILTASTKSNEPVEVAGRICRKKGRVIVVGAVGMTIPRDVYYEKELDLRLSTSYGPGRYDPAYEEKGQDYPYGYVRWTENRNMAAFLELIAARKIDVNTLTSHRFDIEHADQAYAMIMSNSEPYLGVLLDYSSERVARAERKVALQPGTASAQVNLGIIGAGNHVKDMLLPALKSIKSVNLRAVCTATGINARDLGEKLGAAYCTTDSTQIFDDPAIHAVLIGTRHNTHGKLVLAAAQAKKHVFVEKPLCLTEQELDEIESTYQDGAAQGLILRVGFNRNFSNHFRRAKSFFQGRHNPLVMQYRVNAGALPAKHWSQDPSVGGGRILGEACHFIALMAALCEASPATVYAVCIGSHQSGITDDQSILSLRFTDGSIGTVIYAAGGDTRLEKERIEVFGDGKSLVITDFLVSEYYANGKRDTFKSRARDKGFAAQMQSFVSAINGTDDQSMPLSQLLAVTRATIAAGKSLRNGQPIPL